MTADKDLTGNDYVSIPVIGSDSAIDRINVLHGAHAGLIEWAGPDGSGALLRPRISLGDIDVPMNEAKWRRLDRWIPTFTVTMPDGSTVTGTICAPGGYPPARGFVIRIEAENRGRGQRALRVELDVTWQWSRLIVASARPHGEGNRLVVDEAGTALVLECGDGQGPALAITTSHDAKLHGGTDSLAPLDSSAIITSPNGTLLRGLVVQESIVQSNSGGSVAYWIGIGRERDSAIAAANGLGRYGADQWLRQARLELSHTVRPAQDHRWAELLNRNLIFNRYYAVGRAIDDDRIYMLRSRSPECSAPALFNEREALFWTLPALMVADPGVAREAMSRVFETMSERSGEHTRCIDGGAYDAAFSLDQFLLYSWVASRYVQDTDDEGVLDDPIIRQVMSETDTAAYMRLHPQHMLAATELLPSGDVADYPFATMSNVLLWSFCERVQQLLPQLNGDDAPPRFQGAASEVAAAIWQHCVSDVEGDPVLVSSSNLEGEAAIYDDPAMSLALLPSFGFCAIDDPVWRATMDFLRSSRYPLWRSGAVPGLAARAGDPRPRLAALCADLLADGAADALDRLQKLRLPAGVAAAGYDVDGVRVDAPHHAALAGFLAWALVQSAEPKDELAGRRKKRR